MEELHCFLYFVLMHILREKLLKLYGSEHKKCKNQTKDWSCFEVCDSKYKN